MKACTEDLLLFGDDPMWRVTGTICPAGDWPGDFILGLAMDDQFENADLFLLER